MSLPAHSFGITESASSPSVALLRKLCVPPILLVKYLLLITHYPGGRLLSVFRVLWPDVWFSVFVSGVGLWGRNEWEMSPCPLVKKNNSLTEIPGNCGFLLAFGQNPTHQVYSSVTHTHLPPSLPLPTPQLHTDHAQCRPLQQGLGCMCTALDTVGDP